MSAINLDQWFEEQKGLEDLVTVAELDLKEQVNALEQFNDKARTQAAQMVLSGQTTGDPLVDEGLLIFGLDKPKIDRLLAFSNSLVNGKEILIAVHQRVCTKHVMFDTPDCHN